MINCDELEFMICLMLHTRKSSTLDWTNRVECFSVSFECAGLALLAHDSLPQVDDGAVKLLRALTGASSAKIFGSR